MYFMIIYLFLYAIEELQEILKCKYCRQCFWSVSQTFLT